MSSRRLFLSALLLLLTTRVAEGQYRNYSLRCLAPILDSIDPNAPKTLQEASLGGPKRFAEPIEGVGAETISFPISTDSEKAQQLFEQGIALLHVMWYKEAERAFRTVVELDPDCPMGYWGLAQANERSPQRARIFAEAARDRCDRNRPEIEQRWTSLIADYYADTEILDNSARSSSRVRALEELTLDFPDHLELKAFLIRRLTLDQFIAGLPITSALGVDTLAKEFAEKYPEHPSRHYRPFLWMSRRPDRLLNEVVEMIHLTPRAAEIWRYAAEAYLAAGRSAEAAIFAEAAIRTDNVYLQERNSMPWEAQNLMPNYEAFVNLLTNAGRVDEALVWARHAISLPMSLLRDEEGAEHLWAESLMKTGQWDRLLNDLKAAEILVSSKSKGARSSRYLWTGLAHLALGHSEKAQKVADELAAFERESIIAGASTAEEKSITESRETLTLVSRLLSSDLGNEETLSLEKIDLPLLVKARFYETAGRQSKALQLIETDLEMTPYSWLSTAEYCRLAMETGHQREALFRMDRRFRADADRADSNLPVMDELDSLAKMMRLPDSWKLTGPQPRVPSASGPIRWQPTNAPDFALVDRLGQEWKLSQFSGRPVLLHFFLGVQCAFCLEQFDSFKPHLPSFAEAGIDIVAVSIDSQENLKKMLSGEAELDPAYRDRFPFPVLCDPNLDVFREYGVFDDFENGPMHATILVSPDQRILWQNIDHTPFQKPVELLDEANRLLTLAEYLPIP